jgi:hypothetical protein
MSEVAKIMKVLIAGDAATSPTKAVRRPSLRRGAPARIANGRKAKAAAGR